jgi:hypothetical protein
MDVEGEFESRLFDWGIGVAAPWIEAWCESHPWDQRAMGYLVFVHAMDKRIGSLEEAEAVLAVTYESEWALAAVFLLVEPLGEEHEDRFISEKGSLLGPHWVRTFSALGLQEKAEEVYIINLLDGSPSQIADVCFKFDDFKLTPDPERENMSVEEMIKEVEDEM